MAAERHRGRGRLQDKVCIVTGAAGAIGAELCRVFCAEGAKVAMWDCSEAPLRALESELTAADDAEVISMICDISSEREVEASVAAVVARFGRIDVLVNNAAQFIFGSVTHVTAEEWDRVLAVNVKGSALCTKHVARVMRQHGRGSIVNMGSISSFIAQSGFVPYSTTKGALLQLTRCCAADLGPHGIRVNCVCPGAIDTPATGKHAASLGISKDELVARQVAQHMVRRMGSVRDVALATLFLASDESAFVTAAPLMVDGGFVAM